MKLSKCNFGVEIMEGLGFEIGYEHILPKNSHREAMQNYKQPTNGSELLTFSRVVQFFARHIECAADRMEPLYDVIKGTAWNKKKPKSQKFHIYGWQEKWGRTQEEAFIDLRKELASPKLLVACERGKRKPLITDASGVGYGAFLLQEQKKDDFRPVTVLSRKLKGPETRYTATENEAGAIIFALRQLRAYLDGETFELYTDQRNDYCPRFFKQI